MIKPLKGTGNPKFKPILFSEFLENELKAGYLRHQTKHESTKTLNEEINIFLACRRLEEFR